MLQVVTEFIGVTPVVGKERLISTESAQPSRGAPPGGGLLADCQLVFGPMQMTRGRAFAVAGRAQAGQPSPTSVPVGKQWHQMDGRGLLIESVEYAAILPHLEALQTRAARGEPKAKERRAAEAGQRPEAKPMRTAARVREETGFVIDWILVASSTNTTFATDQTYKVASEVTLSTYIAFQAGTIVKFTPQGSLTLLDPIAACPDLLVPRAVLTHAYDDSIGEPITSGDPEANKYPWALFMESCAKCYPQRLEIRYAQAGMKVDDGEVAAKNCLWRKCTYGVRATAADVTFDGVFMCDVNTLTFDDGGASFFGVDDIVTECSIDLWAPEIVTPPHQVHLSSTT